MTSNRLPSAKYSDATIVEGLIAGDRRITEHFFYRECAGMLTHIVFSVFDGKADASELLSELFIYLAANDWYKLRQFDFRSKLTTWLTVVAIRFFQKKRRQLIENDSSEALMLTEADSTPFETDYSEKEERVRAAVAKMKNERYRTVVEMIELENRPLEEVAAHLGVTMANLYNIRHRALAQLATVMGRKEDWYD